MFLAKLKIWKQKVVFLPSKVLVPHRPSASATIHLQNPSPSYRSSHFLPSSGSAGTTQCFHLAREYLEGFQTPLDIVTGNHDLEALDEFPTDQENLAAFQANYILGAFLGRAWIDVVPFLCFCWERTRPTRIFLSPTHPSHPHRPASERKTFPIHNIFCIRGI